jgi:hypothetical protein
MNKIIPPLLKNQIRILLCVSLFPATALAGDAEITKVDVSSGANGYRFDVTIRHADTGWDHYADGWEVIAPDGKVLGKRVLMHPHVNEQPFTRSLSGVMIPSGTSSVSIRAHDSVHGYNKKVYTVELP